jgi:hypothetical protein
VNVVGYVNVTVTNGQFAMIANPLQAPTNTLGALLPNVPPGTQAYKWNGSSYDAYVLDEFELVWLPHGNTSLAPGEGIFIKNNATTNLTLTFVGEVLQGPLTNALPAGYEIRSSKVPQSGRVTTDLLLPGRPGDQIFKWDPALGRYDAFTFDEFDPVWLPSEPVIGVGESFFVRKGVAENWTRTFTVPQ